MDIVIGNKKKVSGETRISRRYNYRLYPTKEQARQIELTIDICKSVYNTCLYEHKQHYKNAIITLMNNNGLPLEYKELDDGTTVLNCSDMYLSLYRERLTLYWGELHKIKFSYNEDNSIIKDTKHLKSYRDLIKKYVAVVCISPIELLENNDKKQSNIKLLIEQMNNHGLSLNYIENNGIKTVSTTDSDILHYQTMLLLHLCKLHKIPLISEQNVDNFLILQYQKELNDMYLIPNFQISLSDLTHGVNSEYYNQIESGAIASTIRNLDTAFKNFYNGKSKFPTYKKRGYKDSVTNLPCLDRVSGSYTTSLSTKALSECIGKNLELNPYYLNVSLGAFRKHGLNSVLMRYHRPLPQNCYISNYATVIKTPSNEFYISFVVDITDCDLNTKQRQLDTNKSIGIDLSCGHNMFIDSNGVFYNQQKHYAYAEERLGKLRQQLSRMEIGSNNWNKLQAKIAKIESKISRKRKGEIKHSVDALLSKYDYIFIEDLDIAELKKKPKIIEDIELLKQNKPIPKITDKERENLTKCYRSEISYYEYEFEARKELRKLLQDTNIGFLVDYLIERANKLGKTVKKVPRYYASTQTCSSCGSLNKNVKGLLNVVNKTYVCPCCGLSIHRDINAAKNILQKGLLDMNMVQTQT